MNSPANVHGNAASSSLREFARFVYRHKITIVVPTVLLAGAAWIIASATPPSFTTTAVLALDVRKVQIVEHEVVSRLPQDSPVLRTELDFMRSRSLNERVVDRLDLTNDSDALREAGTVHFLWQDVLALLFSGIVGSSPTSDGVPRLTRSQLTGWLLGNLKVTNDSRSLTILVSFTSENPAQAARIANAVAENYLDDQVRTKAGATIKASDWLADQLKKIRQELESSEAAVDDFRRKSGLIDVKGATIPAERLSDLNKQLAAARAERVRAETKLQNARESDPETLGDVLASPIIQQLHKELTQINTQIAENQKYSTFYKLNALDAQAAVVRKQISQEMNRILAGLAGEVQLARKKEAELTQSFQQMESQLGDAAHSGVRLIQLQREADANRSIYETLLSRYKQTLEQDSLAAPDARLISRAEAPGAPDYPNKIRFLLFGTFGGLAVGGAIAFLREGFNRPIRQASEVEAVTGIPVFGLLPKVPRWRGLQPQDYPINDPHSRFCAALVRIHTALRAPNSLDRKEVILVTSAQPGDGKTSFCTSLARSLAKSRIRVLVIDADPYRSQVASSFGASIFPAGAPAVDRSPQLSDIVQADSKSAAHFIAAPNEDDLRWLVHSGGFTTLLEQARRVYDIVIIDTPPVMTSADAALIGRFADTRLLLVRWGRTSWDEMTAAMGFLRLCHVGLDGIVIVGADTGSASYGQLAAYAAAPSDNRSVRPPSDRYFSPVE